MKLVVVGGGLAGTWLSLTALAKGHEVVVISQGDNTALVALSLLRKAWLPTEQRAYLDAAVKRWQEVGCQVHNGAEVTRWNNDTVKHQSDWYAVDPTLPAVDVERINALAYAVDSETVLAEDTEVTGDAVVWCDGKGAGKRTFGATWINNDVNALYTSLPLKVHQLAPYKVLAGVKFQSEARLGSSSASSLPVALRQANEMYDKAVKLGWVSADDDWELRAGTRLQRDKRLTRDSSGWHWSGFHRSGYAIVPATVEEVLNTVELV
jgi:hypothetical protein